MSVVGEMLTWTEFTKSVQKGDVFQFFAHDDGAYEHSHLHNLQGERLVVHDIHKSTVWNEVYVVKFDKEGEIKPKSAFYATERDRKAVYRILERQDPQWEAIESNIMNLIGSFYPSSPEPW